MKKHKHVKYSAMTYTIRLLHTWDMGKIQRDLYWGVLADVRPWSLIHVNIQRGLALYQYL